MLADGSKGQLEKTQSGERRKEYLANYYKENKGRISEQRKEKRKLDSSVAASERRRYEENASFREKKIIAARERRAKIKQDKTLKEAEAERRKNRLKDNPEIKERINERARARHNERMASDAGYREARKLYSAKFCKKSKSAGDKKP